MSDATNCAEHPGAWAANCPTCEGVRDAYIREHGEWSLGDSGACDFSNLVLPVVNEGDEDNPIDYVRLGDPSAAVSRQENR